ncbi:hypothetical protein ACFX12_016635 [Malus domestica]
MAAGMVVVFDFDKTIIDCDSDNWVVDELGVEDLFTQLLPTMPWNPLMDRMMTALHARRKTIQDISECLKRVPIHPNIVSAIKSAHAFGCDLRVLSDANDFFIDAILKHHGIMDCFSEIKTNPSFIDEQRRLRILPFHDFISSSHGCTLCPPNMCKGLVMEKIRASVSADGKKHFIYVGDGAPDFCAGLKLEEGDFLLPRKNYPIWDLISANPLLTKAKIHEWNECDELGTILLNTVKAFFIGDKSGKERSNRLVPIDCKSQSSSVSASAHDAFQNALPVPPPRQ